MTDPIDTTIERWLPIPEWEGVYSISDKGRARSERKPDRVLVGGKTKAGYVFVGLSRKGVVVHKYIHSLVMLAFIGPRPEGKEVNHIDAMKANNRLENLEYVTRLENMRHAFKRGMNYPNRKGCENSRAKLCDEAVVCIRAEAGKGETLTALAKQYNVSRELIGKIVNRKSWTHI